MTLVLSSAAGQLLGLQLGLNEIASALVIGKSVGSLFTRQADANIFALLESNFDVRVTSVPAWLEGVNFKRSTLIHGEKMRHIRVPKLMDEIQIQTLEGFATLIVLCCRYTETISDMVDILEMLIRGDLTSTVHGGKFKNQVGRSELPHMTKPLLATFIRATIDSDADSLQTQQAKQLLAKLGAEIGVSLRLRNASTRGRQKTIGILSALLGSDTTSFPPGATKFGEAGLAGQVVANTMSMSAAAIALAASANGAEVCVECITSQARKLVPHPEDGAPPPRFLVQLWLCQPPPSISNFVMQSPKGTSPDAYIVFGGNMEVALNVARELGYTPEKSRADAPLRLWNAGVLEGQRLTWVVRPFQRTDDPVQVAPHVYFKLQDNRQVPIVKRCVDQLAQSLVDRDRDRDKRLSVVARNIAQIVHEEYFYDEYIDCQERDTYFAAMEFVLIAVAVGSLQSLGPGTDCPYALNTGSVTLSGSGAERERSGELRTFIPQAFGQGLGHSQLLWASALLWGGASYESQGFSVTNDRTLGIVAPHCTIILEIIRDPIRFARDGLRGKLISVHRGSVPILPRDPNSGFVQSADLGSRGRRSDVRCDEGGQHLCEPPTKGLVITFEPDIFGKSFTSLFFGWHGGDLAFELDALLVFRNVLLRRFDIRETGGIEASGGTGRVSSSNRVRNRRWLGSTELVQMQDYYAENGYVVFKTYSDPAWIVACAGCAQRGQAIVQIGPLDVDSCQLENGDTIIHHEL